MVHKVWNNLETQVPELKVPVHFQQGKYDYHTPHALAKRCFEKLRAPLKEMVEFSTSRRIVGGQAANSEDLASAEIWAQGFCYLAMSIVRRRAAGIFP